MPVVADLRCMGSAATRANRINAGPIARDDLDAGMAFGPGCDRVDISIRQQIEDAVALKIANERSVALPLAPGQVVDADHTRHFRWF